MAAGTRPWQVLFDDAGKVRTRSYPSAAQACAWAQTHLASLGPSADGQAWVHDKNSPSAGLPAESWRYAWRNGVLSEVHHPQTTLEHAERQAGDVLAAHLAAHLAALPAVLLRGADAGTPTTAGSTGESSRTGRSAPPEKPGRAASTRGGKRHALGGDGSHTLCGRVVRSSWKRHGDPDVQCSRCVRRLAAQPPQPLLRPDVQQPAGRRLVNLPNVVLTLSAELRAGYGTGGPGDQLEWWTVVGVEQDLSLGEDPSASPKMFTASLVVARPEDYNVWEACDASDGDLESIAAAVLDPSSGRLRDELRRRQGNPGGDLLIVNQVTLAEPYRGSGLGRLLTAMAMAHLGRGCGLAALLPAGLDTTERRYTKRARAATTSIWADLGFTPYRGVMVMDLTGGELSASIGQLTAGYLASAQADHRWDPEADTGYGELLCRRCGADVDSPRHVATEPGPGGRARRPAEH